MSPAELKCMARAWNELLSRGSIGQFGGDHRGVRHSHHSKVREQGFKTLGSWITFDGHLMKEIVERDRMEVFLCDTTPLV